MPSRHLLTAVSAVIVAVLALTLGCSKGPTPEQIRADSTLTKATGAMTRGAIRESRRLFQRCLVLEEAIERKTRTGEILRLLGDGYAVSGQFDSALDYYDRAAVAFRNMADRQSIWMMTLKTAALRRQMGEERKAFTMYGDALRLAKVFEDADGIRDIEWAMLPCARAIEETAVGQQLMDDLTKEYTASQNSVGLARVAIECGLDNLFRSLYDQAVQNFLHAVSLAGQGRDTLLVATAMLRLGQAYDALGKGAEAFQAYGDAMTLSGRLRDSRSFRLELMMRIGNSYLRYRQPADAARFYRPALSVAIALNNRVAEGYLAIQLGHCSMDVAPAEASTYFISAASLFNDLGYGRGAAYAQASAGLLAQRSGKLATASEHYTNAVNEREAWFREPEQHDLLLDCEQAVFGTSRTYLYDRLIDLQLQTGKTEEAFWYSERKTRSELFRLLRTVDPMIPDASLRGELEQYHHACSIRMGAEQGIEQLLRQGGVPAEGLQEVRAVLQYATKTAAQGSDRIVRIRPALDPFVRIDGVGLAELQKRIPPGTALLHYVVSQRALYAYVVTRDRTTLHLAAVDREQVLRTVGEFTELFRQREAASDSISMAPSTRDPRLTDYIRALTDWFVRPVEAQLRTASRIIVLTSPDFPWFPLHVLRTGPLTTSPYLVERYFIGYLPAASAFLLPDVPATGVRDVVAMGFAGGRAWDVEYELRDVRAFYKDARLRFQQQATISTLRKERGDLLHLTIPCSVNERVPESSFLLLSDGKIPPSTTAVPLGELFSVPAFSSVVISDLAEGGRELRSGVPFIFLMNGTGTVVMNGLVPPRKAKKYFGEMFYTSLLGGTTPGNALRMAQMQMIRNSDYASPYVWGPFFAWGK